MVEKVTVEQGKVGFDYSAEAELFPTRNRKSQATIDRVQTFCARRGRRPLRDRGAPPEFLLGAHLEVDEERYDGRGIRRLYEGRTIPWSAARRLSAMTTRSHSKSVVFSHPFELKGVDRILPPGDYRVVTDEEMIEELSFPVYRRMPP